MRSSVGFGCERVRRPRKKKRRQTHLLRGRLSAPDDVVLVDRARLQRSQNGLNTISGRALLWVFFFSRGRSRRFHSRRGPRPSHPRRALAVTCVTRVIAATRPVKGRRQKRASTQETRRHTTGLSFHVPLYYAGPLSNVEKRTLRLASRAFSSRARRHRRERLAFSVHSGFIWVNHCFAPNSCKRERVVFSALV
jgi:hypothetical protein